VYDSRTLALRGFSEPTSRRSVDAMLLPPSELQESDRPRRYIAAMQKSHRRVGAVGVKTVRPDRESNLVGRESTTLAPSGDAERNRRQPDRRLNSL